MTKYKINIKNLDNIGISLLFGEPVVFHCNHYNLFLQRTIEDASEYIPSEQILTDGGAISIYAMLKQLFNQNSQYSMANKRLSIASYIYSYLGFGLLDLSSLSEEGGSITTPVTHYSYAWKQKWGQRDKPVDFFTCGFIQAAAAIAFGKPINYYHVQQSKCVSMGAEENQFEIKRNPNPRVLPVSPGSGVNVLQQREVAKIATNLDEKGITETIRGLELIGNADGLIPAFGVYLTRHFANYYNYISYEMVRYITQETGEPDLARDLLIEAGHGCAFNTFGGIMKSDEWAGMIEPNCKTKEDWASGIIAVANAFGWGYWAIQELLPGESMKLAVDGSYESNGYLGAYGQSDSPIGFLLTGGAAGLMNLLYHGDITEKPELNAEYYDSLFSSDKSFIGTQTHCRAKGDTLCEVSVNRLDISE
ncbi:MAG: 4-vinyl reductase [Spirochaetota bacterium]